MVKIKIPKQSACRATRAKVPACPVVSKKAMARMLRTGRVYQRTKGVFIQFALAYEKKWGMPRVLRSGKLVARGPPVLLSAMKKPDGWDDFCRVHTNARMVGHIPRL